MSLRRRLLWATAALALLGATGALTTVLHALSVRAAPLVLVHVGSPASASEPRTLAGVTPRAPTSEVSMAPSASEESARALVPLAPVPELEPPEALTCAAEPPLPERHLVAWSLPDVARWMKQDPARLGSASIGTVIRGKLWGAVRLMPSEGIDPAGGHPFGTEVAVRSIERAVREVRRCHPGTPKLFVGDISRDTGGWLRPHRSHQSGLDADIGYYYSTGAVWFLRADAKNLDRRRTWALIEALVGGGTVEAIFMDLTIQRYLAAYAESIGVAKSKIDRLFGSRPRDPDAIVKHAYGHATHFHVRFSDPVSVALGTRIEQLLPPPFGAQRR